VGPHPVNPGQIQIAITNLQGTLRTPLELHSGDQIDLVLKELTPAALSFAELPSDTNLSIIGQSRLVIGDYVSSSGKSTLDPVTGLSLTLKHLVRPVPSGRLLIQASNPNLGQWQMEAFAIPNEVNHIKVAWDSAPGFNDLRGAYSEYSQALNLHIKNTGKVRTRRSHTKTAAVSGLAIALPAAGYAGYFRAQAAPFRELEQIYRSAGQSQLADVEQQSAALFVARERTGWLVASTTITTAALCFLWNRMLKRKIDSGKPAAFLAQPYLPKEPLQTE
jgi:hypothetical protein